MYFSAALSSENDHGSMNLASNTAPLPSTRPSRVAAIHRTAGCRIRRWMSMMTCPELSSYQRRLRSSVADPSWTMRLPDRSSGWVVNSKSAVLSVITGGGKWVEIATHADALYQHLIVTAERKFWRCVESGEPPRLFGVEPPKPRIEAVRIVDMSASNAWAEFAAVFSRTRSAHLDHEQAKAELKGLMPEDAKEAIGHGIRAKRSKSGAVSFDLLSVE
jgi:hypothetical protein